MPVTLAARATAIGTLELSCVAADGSNRWKLEFNTRDESGGTPDTDSEEARDADGRGEALAPVEVVPEPLVQAAGGLILSTYSGEAGAPTPAELPKALEALLESPRHEWPTGLLRRLFGFLVGSADQRRRSPAHLARWQHLAGYWKSTSIKIRGGLIRP